MYCFGTNMAHVFIISDIGLALIKSYEGFRPLETILVSGQHVIGYGHECVEGEAAELTDKQASELLEADLEPFIELINNNVHAPLSQSQFDALVSLSFNIGAYAFLNSTVLHYLNNGQTLAAAAGFDEWRKSTISGKVYVVDALVRRRTAEKALFLSLGSAVITASRNEIMPERDTKILAEPDGTEIFDNSDARGLVDQTPYALKSPATHDVEDEQYRRKEDGPAGVLTLSERIAASGSDADDTPDLEDGTIADNENSNLDMDKIGVTGLAAASIAAAGLGVIGLVDDNSDEPDPQNTLALVEPEQDVTEQDEPKLGAGEHGDTEQDTLALNGSEIETPQYGTTDQDNSEIETPDIETPDIETPDIETPDIETPDIETMAATTSEELNAPEELDTLEPDHTKVESTSPETSHQDSAEPDSSETETGEIMPLELVTSDTEAPASEVSELETSESEILELDSSEPNPVPNDANDNLSPIAAAAAEVSARLDNLIDKTSEPLDTDTVVKETPNLEQENSHDDDLVGEDTHLQEVDSPSLEPQDLNLENEDLENAIQQEPVTSSNDETQPEAQLEIQPEVAPEIDIDADYTDDAEDTNAQFDKAVAAAQDKKRAMPLENYSAQNSDRPKPSGGNAFRTALVVGGLLFGGGIWKTMFSGQAKMDELSTFLAPVVMLVGAMMILGGFYYLFKSKLRGKSSKA